MHFPTKALSEDFGAEILEIDLAQVDQDMAEAILYARRRFSLRLLANECFAGDKKEHVVDELKGIGQHHLVHGVVIGAAPVGSGQEGLVYFDIASRRGKPIKARRADDLAVLGIERVGR